MDEIRSAILEDCENIINRFAKHSNYDFKFFCYEWKKIHFHHNFSALKKYKHMIILTDEFLRTVKKLLVGVRPDIEKVGALYLLYSIYFLQPAAAFCKIRVTLEDWINLKAFIEHLKQLENTEKAQCVFWKLVEANAFKFVQVELVHGFERFFQNNEKSEQDAFCSLKTLFNMNISEVKHESRGILTAMEILDDGYNEMKELIPDMCPKLPQTNIFAELNSDFDKIIKLLQPSVSKNHLADDDDSLSSDNAEESRFDIKKRAFSGQKNLESNSAKAYDVSLCGDFIKIVNKDNRLRGRNQSSTKIFSQKLPKDIADELEIEEH